MQGIFWWTRAALAIAVACAAACGDDSGELPSPDGGLGSPDGGAPFGPGAGPDMPDDGMGDDGTPGGPIGGDGDDDDAGVDGPGGDADLPPIDPCLDEDGDGAGCYDDCPRDPLKVFPGDCGCGTPDDDSDQDGARDCIEECPMDADKTEAGVCGCGVSDGDSDGDGAIDCEDECPMDPLAATRGTCGCLGADSPTALGTECDDSLCPGPQTCDGAGRCGSVDACQKPEGHGCGDPQVHGGHIYYLCTTNRSWQAARDACTSATGFDLVAIGSQAEADFVHGLSNNDIWIGAQQVMAADTWQMVATAEVFWTEGGGGMVVEGRFNAWRDGEPDGTGDCAYRDEGDAAWRDQGCGSLLDFVCEGTN